MAKQRRTKPTRFILAHVIAIAMGLLMVRTLILPMLEEQQAQAFQNRLDTVTTEIASFIQARRAEVRLLADLPVTQTLEWQRIRPLLMTRLNQSNQDFEKFVLGLESSHAFTTSAGNPFQGDLISFDDSDPNARLKSLSRRDYWRTVIAHNEDHRRVDYVSNPMVSYTTGIKQIIIASSIHRDDRVVGLLGGSISWQRITELIDHIIAKDTEFTAQFMLVSKDGNYWYHWDPEKVIRTLEDQQGNPLKNDINEASVQLFNILADPSDEVKSLGRNMVSGKSGQLQIKIDGSPKKVFFGPIENTNYSLAQVVDKNDYLAPKRQFNVYLLVAFIASMMVYLFLVYLIPKDNRQ